jgi:hypothetical protein
VHALTKRGRGDRIVTGKLLDESGALAMERQFLRDKFWWFDESSGFWLPPK